MTSALGGDRSPPPARAEKRMVFGALVVMAPFSQSNDVPGQQYPDILL